MPMMLSKSLRRIALFLALSTSTVALPSPPSTATSRPSHRTPSRTPSSSASHKATPTSTGFAVIQTQIDGEVIGCTASTLLKVTEATGVITSTLCQGTPTPITTYQDEWNSWESLVSALVPITAPAHGCEIVTPIQGAGSTQYCTCGGGHTTSASSVPTIIALSSTSLTTVCSTPNAIPTGYIEVPQIALPEFQPGGVDLLWTEPPSSNCSDIGNPDPSCWESLDMDGFLQWWWGEYESTCNKTSAYHGFGDCFVNIMTDIGPSNCSIIDAHETCKSPSSGIFEKYPWNYVRIFYATWSVFNINGFFSDYHSTIGGVSSIASGSIANIAKIVQPADNTNVELNDVLSVLSFGLAFLSAPEGAPAWFGTLLTGLGQAIGVAQTLFPESSPSDALDKQVMNWANVSDSLAKVTPQLQTSISNALVPAIHDIDSFLALSANGQFSGTDFPTLDGLENAMLPGLYTFIISSLLNANSIILTRAWNTDVQALFNNGTKLNGYVETGLYGCNEYDKNGGCNTWWYDSSADITYGLTSTSDNDYNATSIMAQLLGYDAKQAAANGSFSGYTTGDMLFAGAGSCSSGGKPSFDITQLNITNGALGLNCLSSLQVCSWGMNYPDPWVTDCPNTKMDIGYTLCDANLNDYNTISQGTSLPQQYLGWAVTQAGLDALHADEDNAGHVDTYACIGGS